MFQPQDCLKSHSRNVLLHSMSVLQCNYMYLYHISFMHITVNKLSIKYNQSRHRLPRHSSHRLTHPLPGSVPLSLD